MNDLAAQLGRVAGNLSADALQMLSTRCALLAEEWRMERKRIACVCVVAFAAGIFLALSVIAALAAVILNLPPDDRITGLVVSAAVMAILASAALWILTRWILCKRPFQYSLNELKKDAECLRRITLTK